MVLFALAFLLIIIFLYDIKIFVYSLMIFFVFFDMFDGFYKDENIFAAIRYVIPFGLILFYILKYNAFKKSDLIFLILMIYLLFLLVLNPGDILVSSKTLLAICITLLMIPIGRHLGRNVDIMQEFEGYNRILLISLPVYILIVNLLGIGESYSEEFSTGFLITSRMYVVPIVVFLAIYYVISNKNRSWIIKAIDILFILINICILLINTRRTAIGMLFGAILIYTLLNRRLIFKMAIFCLVTIAALIISYPLYEEMLTAQLDKRERIQNIDTYEEEGRYLETLDIIDYHLNRENIFEFLFGVKLFDTYDFGIKYFGRDRPIHSDINMIIYSTGVIGTIIFILFFIHYFFRKNSVITNSNKKIYYPILIMFLIVLIPGRFIGTLTFAPLLMLLLAALKSGKQPSITIKPKKREVTWERVNSQAEI